MSQKRSAAFQLHLGQFNLLRLVGVDQVYRMRLALSWLNKVIVAASFGVVVAVEDNRFLIKADALLVFGRHQRLFAFTGFLLLFVRWLSSLLQNLCEQADQV